MVLRLKLEHASSRGEVMWIRYVIQTPRFVWILLHSFCLGV